MTPETPSVTYCGQCGRKRTEAEKGTRTPCPNCGSTSFETRIHIEFGIFHHFGLDASIQKSFETATYKATFREMDMTALRGVCEGSKKQIPDIPVGDELDVQAIAKHVYEQRLSHDEWKTPHNLIPIIMSILAFIASVVAIIIALGSKTI